MRAADKTDSPGKLIAIEGIDRAGKSSVIELISEKLNGCSVPITVCAELKSPLAGFLRTQLRQGISAFLKTYLFAADRAWSYEKECLPALRRGHLVIWDRYVDSAIVYRAVELAQGDSLIDMQFVEIINSPFRSPDLTILIDISADISEMRAQECGEKQPYSKEFLNSVREVYLKMASRRKYVIINGEQDLDKVAHDVAYEIKERIPEFFYE